MKIEVQSAVSNESSRKLKEKYIENKFTEYLYHKRSIKDITAQLNWINEELQKKDISDIWLKELIQREASLQDELMYHKREIQQVDAWLSSMSDNHRNIMISYAINNQCRNTTKCARETGNSESNICKSAKREISRIAKSDLTLSSHGQKTPDTIKAGGRG